MVDLEEVKKLTDLKNSTNNTSKFLLPIFGLKIEELCKLGFINAYLKDVNREPTDDSIHIYVLFKPDKEGKIVEDRYGKETKQESQYEKLVKKIEKLDDEDSTNSIYIEDYDYEDGYIVLVLRFPEKFRKDYNRFVKGKYSKLSSEFVNYYPENKVAELINDEGKYEKIAGKSLQWMVCNKDKRVKEYLEDLYRVEIDEDSEYWSVPTSERDHLNIKKLC